ncbi:conserved Plasmodium protein, unknown function [Plasmodium gallinaceum]|uniref:Rhoptry associated adhesin n=1 Tax=Plasmodium gallinaceum TaxID=5849 RepID=A0A1J1GPE7_PLAGA|nr:conserved Plasmodium protein, unknown function [Plasmodium gallinaceum]CRG94180.1 conserved Plasmodium protein, unknown function [Plasmodium gallinaceum]
MKKLFVFLIICIFKIWIEKVKASKFISFKRKKNVTSLDINHLNNKENGSYSFLMTKKENDEEKDNKDGNSKKEKENDENGSNDKKNEENSSNEKRHEEDNVSEKKNKENSTERKHEEDNTNEKKHEDDNSTEKKHEEGNPSEKKNEEDNSNEKKNEEENSSEKNNDESNIKKKDENTPVEKNITKSNLLEYGTHDRDGNFIPSYKTLTDEILSTNNSLEKSLSFLKIACSHILKILEFIPESKLSSQYIKIESKNVYLKDIGSECQSLYFSLQKLGMTVIVLNSKISKLIYVQEK